jgi:hypothetical protein
MFRLTNTFIQQLAKCENMDTRSLVFPLSCTLKSVLLNKLWAMNLFILERKYNSTLEGKMLLDKMIVQVELGFTAKQITEED